MNLTEIKQPAVRQTVFLLDLLDVEGEFPCVFFMIFAVIFAGATGEQLRLNVAMADEVDNDISRRLLDALERDPALSRVGTVGLTATDVRDLVRRGTADVGRTQLDDASSSAKRYAIVTDLLVAGAFVAGGVSLYLTLDRSANTGDEVGDLRSFGVAGAF